MSNVYTAPEVQKAECGEFSSVNSAQVIVIDTDSGVRWSLEKGLSRSGYSVQSASSVAQILPSLHEGRVAVVILEIADGGLVSDDVSVIRDTPSSPQVICTSIDSSPRTVIECMRGGAADFLVKPFSLSEVRAAVDSVLEQNGGDNKGQSADTKSNREGTLLVGLSPALHELRKVLNLASQTNFNCLIRGESGVGKDVVAREIYRLSERRQKPFVKVNCSALPEQLLESELFGYERGAFTGAERSKPGRFSLADQGIIFLDEIGDMHPNVQAKILQVIEHKEFTKLGGGKTVRVDVQIIAASNANLEEKIASGEFRDDLFFRLNEIAITVPPLRSRHEDIPLLVRHFLCKHSQQHGGAEQREISGTDLQALSTQDWPGNVRELESTIKRWIALGGKGPISAQIQAGPRRAEWQRSPVQGDAVSDETKAESVKDRKSPTAEELLRALERNQWNRRRAAKEMRIGYSTLLRCIEKYRLDARRQSL